MIPIYFVLLLWGILPPTCTVDAACPPGWDKFDQNCYKKFSAASWDQAKEACPNHGAKIAEIEIRGEEENTFIKNTFGGGLWLGLSRCHTSSTCLLDFSPVLWRNWAPGQPDNEPKNRPGLQTKDFAVVIQADGTWIDQPKWERRPYICKKPEDACKDNFCNPDASTCVNGKCQCMPGFSGEFCYVGPCDIDPCHNGGTCEVMDTNYNCTCINHYSGKNCEVPPPCKTESLCKNGVCEDVSNVDYRCKCNPGWIGKNCTERPCDRQPCVSAKKCINKGSGYQCVCLDGWNGANCDKLGYAGGDPHYMSFDGKRFDFMGKCEYVFAKDCSQDHAFEILQQNEVCGSGKVSCTKSIRIFVHTIEVKMERRGVVYIDGIRVDLPWKMSGHATTITRWAGGAFLNVPDLLFSVRWDGRTGIYVRINQLYQNKTCGLMGNADNNQNNDFQLPDRSFTNNITKFGNSWKKNPRCMNGIAPEDPCTKLSTLEYNAIKEKCNEMKQPPFKQCNERITPDIGYVPNCEYDMCAMKVNPSAPWCLALENYDRACRLKGVDINWEEESSFAECRSPCANMPCYNGAKCENINRKEFKCTCSKGFSGSTCENIECKSGYVARGNVCYKKMSRRPWLLARCPIGEEFVLSRNDDENKFIYNKFVKHSTESFWMNARVCDTGKLCDQSFSKVFYHNFVEQFPTNGCVSMVSGKDGKWIGKNCRSASYYVCKYENN